MDLEDVDLEVDEKRFRPNFLIDGTFPAFDEETWVWVKMGDVVFRYSQVSQVVRMLGFPTSSQEMTSEDSLISPLLGLSTL